MTSKDSLYLFNIEAKKENPNREKMLRLAKSYALSTKADEETLKRMARVISPEEKPAQQQSADQRLSDFNTSLYQMKNILGDERKAIKNAKLETKRKMNYLKKIKKAYPKYKELGMTDEYLESSIDSIISESTRTFGDSKRDSFPKIQYEEKMVDILKTELEDLELENESKEIEEAEVEALMKKHFPTGVKGLLEKLLKNHND